MNGQQSSGRRTIVGALGVIMIVLGVGIALRPLVAPGPPVSGSRWLDLAFAAFFLLRGAMNLRMARRRPPAGPPPAS